ncbi:hypothetical protein GC207_03555 [bacterium]|nr:hypothetical protein [bacterium]
MHNLLSLRFGNLKRGAVLFAVLSLALTASAARVTLITHGFNSTVDEWIVPMADRMANYTSFWGTNASIYQINISTNSAGQFVTDAFFLDGTAANRCNSGNIFVLLDWSNVAGKAVSLAEIYPAQYTVTQIADVVTPLLLDANLISDMGGHALAEFPMQMIGHSRGGPLISEIARQLGAHGIWVDQLTMIDPHPCDPANSFLESIGCPVLDPQPAVFANVYFADDYWQNLGSGLDLTGLPVAGAYNRQLTSLPNGYNFNHSNSHLWYHGTIDFASPAFDGGAYLYDSDRASWYSTAETNGLRAGFFYSQLGGGDRNSTNQPAGAGTAEIRDGLIGIGARQALPSNDGTWPNVVQLSAINPGRFEFNSEPGLAVREVNVGYPNGTLTVTASYQAGQGGSWQVFLDPDANDLNGNEIVIGQEALEATGTAAVSNIVRAITINPAQIANGEYYLGSRITSTQSTKTRVQYAPQKVAVLAPLQLTILPGGNGAGTLEVIGSSGYDTAIDASTDLSVWQDAGTYSFTSGAFGEPVTIDNPILLDQPGLFFRAHYVRPTP